MPSIDNHKPGSFCWYELATTDQAAAKNFYTSLFGWSVNDYPMGPSEVYSMFGLEGKEVGAAYTLRPEQRSQGVPPHWMVYVAVENADEIARRAGELDAAVYAGPFDVADYGRMAVMADPTGAVFSIWQAKQHPGVGIEGVDGSACWVDLTTPDTERAQKFYSELFGWTTGADKDSGYIHIQNGEEYIGGMQSSAQRNAQAPPHWMIYFLASDCDAFAGKAKDLGGQVLLPPTEMENVGRMGILRDPQGAVFALFQPAPRQGQKGE